MYSFYRVCWNNNIRKGIFTSCYDFSFITDEGFDLLPEIDIYDQFKDGYLCGFLKSACCKLDKIFRFDEMLNHSGVTVYECFIKFENFHICDEYQGCFNVKLLVHYEEVPLTTFISICQKDLVYG